MICDYEGSDYKQRFWQNADRAYEDAVERIALRRLLPPRGRRIVEYGAGFGRLADLYAGYDEIVLLDYSRTMLAQAMERWGGDPRFRFVAADIYHLPFAGGAMSAASMIRVIHHIADVPGALGEIRRTMAPGGTFVLEFANKRNLKAVARYALRRQAWSPFAPQPVEFVKLNFDFHPRWMLQQLRNAGFDTRQTLAVSYLRAGLFKRVVPVQWMVFVDAFLQRTAPLALLSPSVFVQNVRARQTQDAHRTTGKMPEPSALENERSPVLDGAAFESILRSPMSGAPLRRDGELLVCDADGTRWQAHGHFYDLKEPL
ncbi:MAG: class I SAM-dependent methyltransferase [Chloroflexi bacterium]|nr:class I SAM-dependent methyltransferase [Chloroflexota bacterium]